MSKAKARNAPFPPKGRKAKAISLWPRNRKQILLLVGKYVLMLWALSLAWVIAFRFVDPPGTLLMFQRKNEGLEQTAKWKTLKYEAVSMSDVSKEAPLAMIAAEDQRFMNHSGFDFKAMKQAYENNKKGKMVRGGSTISQQVAKNVFLWNGRSYVRKGLEVYFTSLIELLWGKKRIMEMYLSVAETGDHVFGVHAATKWAFRKEPSSLSRAEAATIAAVLPNPRKFSVRKPSAYTIRRRNRIVTHMRRIGGTAAVQHFY